MKNLAEEFLLVVIPFLILCKALDFQHHLKCPLSCDCMPTNKVKGITHVKCVGSDASILFIDIPITTEHLIIQSSPDITNNIIPAISGFHNLQTLDLSFNSIKFLPSDKFQSIRLSHINLSNNLLESLRRETFDDLKELTYLNLSNNHIRDIEVHAFDNLKGLQQLDLSFNKIQNISKNIFIRLLNLEELFLQGNNIQNWDAKITLSNSNLRVLDLSQNNLTQMTGESSQNLTQLNIGYNKMTNLSVQYFMNIHTLQTLKLDGNLFKKIPSFVFKKLNKLKKLYMCHLPNLRNISKSAFSGLVNLKLLAICDNPILSFVNIELFQSIPSLETLDLSDNKISVLHQTTFHENKQLKSLKISGNLLWCDCDLTWILQNGEKNSTTTKSRVVIENLDQLVCYNHTNFEPIQLKLLSPNQLHCGGIYLRNYTTFAKYKIGASAFLHCQVNGQPVPMLTWRTPRNKLLRYHNIHTYAIKDLPSVHTAMDDNYHERHHWHKSETYHSDLSHNDRIQVLDDGTLYIDYVLRSDAGAYICQAENPSGTVNASISFHLDYSVLTQVKIMSIIVGIASAFAFFTLNLIYVLIVAVARRCINQKRKETIKTLIESLDNYKSTQVNKLMENYHTQVGKIRDQYKIRFDKLRDNYGCQVDRIRGIREGCSQQVDRMRDNYNNQLNRLKDYSSHQVEQLRDMYTNQIVKIRGYGSQQMGRIRENYKVQQQHAMKLLETMNLDNCRTAVDADCLRTDSMLLDVEIVPDIHVHPQPDSSSESEYATALCSREGSPISSPLYTPDNGMSSESETLQCCDTSSEDDQYNGEIYLSSTNDQNEVVDESIQDSQYSSESDQCNELDTDNNHVKKSLETSI